MAQAGAAVLMEGLSTRTWSAAVRQLVLGVVVLAVVGGAVLTLPVCWQGPYPVHADHPLVRYQFGVHALECLFTAAAAAKPGRGGRTGTVPIRV